MINFFLIAFGGFIGSILRYTLSLYYYKSFLGTLIANLTGSLVLAVVFYFYINQTLSDSLWLFLGVGICGAYTTFSTFSLEIVQLLFEKKYSLAFTYLLSSFFIPFISVAFIFYQ